MWAKYSKTAMTMPTAADIQKAAERIDNGTDVIGTVMKMKKETRTAIANGATDALKAAGYKIFSFNASTI